MKKIKSLFNSKLAVLNEAILNNSIKEWRSKNEFSYDAREYLQKVHDLEKDNHALKMQLERINEIYSKNISELSMRLDEAADKEKKMQKLLDQVASKTQFEDFNKMYSEKTLELSERLNKAVNGQKNIQDSLKQLEIEQRKNNLNLKDSLEKEKILARGISDIKWKQIDLKEELFRDDFDQKLACIICGHTDEQEKYKKYVSECIFNGGKLVRYECPECGAIFGPSKFRELTQKEIDEDYAIHYTGFSEGDSSEKEIRAFYMLNPKKDKIYLNYGCGSWSKSLQKLRDEGYQVYGYEPYSPELGNPYMITSKEEVSKWRFDGIFSNDLIEHLINPIEDFKFMKSLLKSSQSKMAHSTSCYIYKYEYTRFHTCFYTGKSVDILCQKTGLKVINKVDDIKENDFICYVYQPIEDGLDYLSFMMLNEFANKEGNKIILHRNGIMYGPYITLNSGRYRWTIDITCDKDCSIKYRVTTNIGKNILAEGYLTEEIHYIDFQIADIVNNLEFVVENCNAQDASILKLSLSEI